MPDPPLRKYTFLQCVIIFWFLTNLVDKHDRWLSDNSLPKRFLGSQYEADLYKGWFFWMFLSRLNSNDMKVRFKSQEWDGYSPRSDPRWFGCKLTAWGWPMPTQANKQIREEFINFICEIPPPTELELQRDDPKISQYIKVPGWTMLPSLKANQHHEASFSDLEEQALVLYNDKQALSSWDPLNSYGLVNSSSSHPSPIGQRPSEPPLPAFPEPPGVTNVRTPHPRAPNTPSISPQFAKEKMQANEIPKAIDRSNRPFVASRDTDRRSTATDQISRSRPPASRYKPLIIEKNSSNSTKSPSTPKRSSKMTVQSGHSDKHSPSSDNHRGSNQRNAPRFPEPVSPLHHAGLGQRPLPSTYAGQCPSMGLSTQSAYAVDRPPFPPRPQHGIHLLNQPTLGTNNSAHNPRRSEMTNVGQNKPQALSNLPSHPQGQLRPSLNYRRRQNSSPTTADSKLPQRSLPQVDSTRQPAPTPKRQKVESFSPASVNSSIVTSPSAWSPYSQSSFISTNSNTPSQVWSASSSPLPSHHGTIPAKECSSVNIEGRGTEVPDRPPLMSPGSVMQAVNARLSEQSESLPEASTSGRHSTPSRDTLPCRPLTYAGEPMASTGVEADGVTQDPASIAQETTQANDVEANDALVEVGKSNSDNESVGSGTETTDEDRDLLLDYVGDDGDADNNDNYAVDLSIVDIMNRLIQ